MTDETKPAEPIPPAETDKDAFAALMAVAHEHGGFSEIIYRMGLKIPSLFDPAQARVNAKAIATALRKAANQLCDATRPPGQPRVRELYSIHGEASGVWFCEKCKYTARSEAEALRCCSVRYCETCGSQYRERSYTCQPCWTKEQIEKAAAAWAKAEPIDAAAYTGEMIYVETEDGHPYGGSHDGYFCGVEELAECVADGVYEDAASDFPTLYVYATSATRLSLDADNLLENGLEEFHEDARNEISTSAEEELQAYLTAWADKNSPTTYYPDYSKKITGWEDYVPPAEESESSDDDQEEADA